MENYYEKINSFKFTTEYKINSFGLRVKPCGTPKDLKKS